MIKALIKIILVLAILVYVGYGVGCTVQHNITDEVISPYCASCWALKDLL